MRQGYPIYYISYLLFLLKVGIMVSESSLRQFEMEVGILNFEEELEKFQPSMDVEKVEDVVYNNNLTDLTDIVKELIQDAKGTL